ncbi:MAG: CAP domain-containing protein [Candidatus Peribacteraceae bacterium]
MLRFLTIVICIVTLAQSAQATAPVTVFLTRAQAADLLLRASREVLPPITDSSVYPDVIPDQWYTQSILYATQLTMLDPEPESGLLFPHRSISRAEFLKMMTIAFGLERELPQKFSDVSDDAWYAPFVGIAQIYQLFSDTQDSGELHPLLRMTEDDALVALKKLFEAEPFLQPRTFSFSPDQNHITGTPSTPNLVKRALLNIFRKHSLHPEETRQDILALVNAERAKMSLPALVRNRLLELSAQNHAQDMTQRKYFSHVTPDGLDYVDRIRASNYLTVDQSACGCRSIFNVRALIEQSRTETTPQRIVAQTEVCGCTPHFAVGENIAKGQLTPQQVMQDWMNSPGHRSNILHPQFEEMGVGIFGAVWVQDFGRVVLDQK